MMQFRLLLHAAGSLWFAAVLLMLLLVAMACATVFESTHGTPRALAEFYRSWWFTALLGLICVNLLAAVLRRYPFTTKHIGLIITHVAIVITLGGALVTQEYGVDGQVGVREGETVAQFSLRGDALVMVDRANGEQTSVELESAVFVQDEVIDNPRAPRLRMGDITIEIERYLPDSTWQRAVFNSDNEQAPPALEIAISSVSGVQSNWLFAGQPAAELGSSKAIFRRLASEADLNSFLNPSADEEAAPSKLVQVKCAGKSFEFPMAACMANPVPLGETGYTIRVLRYLPHAMVGADNKLGNASNDPVNPAIELEVTGPGTHEKRFAFAKFPGFKHGEFAIEEVDVTFVAGDAGPTAPPIEIARAPDGVLYVRFTHSESPTPAQPIAVGTPIDTPWPGSKLEITQKLDHAQAEWMLESVPEERSAQQPGLLLKVSTAEDSAQTWLQKFRPRVMAIDDREYELLFGNEPRPLGFQLTLNQFRVGTYPGGHRPRSFESSVTTVEPTTGRTQNHVISMNHPAKVGGYTIYQSSYREQPGGPSISYLSVAWDPGQPIVFTGYILMMFGMLWVLVTRIRERLAASRASVGAPVAPHAETRSATRRPVLEPVGSEK